MDKVLQSLASLIERLTWTKLVLLVLLGISVISGYALFENRQLVYTTAVSRFDKIDPHDNVIKVGESSKRMMYETLRADSNIVLISVLDLDMTANKRTPVYRAVQSKKVEEIIDTASDRGANGNLPMFTTNEIQNRQMISLLNGEFSCGSSEGSGIISAYPELKSEIQWSCRVPIPPYYGNVSGYIVVHMKRRPTDYELDRIRLAMFQISTIIFNEEQRQAPVKVIS